MPPSPTLPHILCPTRFLWSTSLCFLLVLAFALPCAHITASEQSPRLNLQNWIPEIQAQSIGPKNGQQLRQAEKVSIDHQISSILHIESPHTWSLENTLKTVATIFCLLALYSVYYFHTHSLRRQKKRLESLLEDRTSNLAEANASLEARQIDIERQNRELSEHRNTLEALVKERTEKMETALIRAEDSERLKSVFLANVSHEIRTPMNAIVGFSSLLEDPHVTDSERSEYVELIRGNADVLIGLIDDIVEVSRIEAKQVASSYNRFDLDLKLEELEIYYKTANRRPIEVNFLNRGYTSPLIIETDELLFGQIMNCLIGNAIKYTTQGSVDFGYQLSDQNVTLYVTDTGIGIPEHEHEKIFDRFYKITQKGSELYRGLGLGLSITRSLVRLLEGEIWLKSKPGKGSTFYVRLPLQKSNTA